MKNRSILPFAVLGILLALLLAVSSCGGDESDDDRPGDSNGAQVVAGPSDEFSKQVGGPYSFAPKGEKAREKERDFECYKELGLSLSEAVKLDDDDLLQDSIIENYDFPDRTDTEKYDTQKYNFVIAKVDGNLEIIVARWKSGAIPDLDREVSQKCQGRQCRKDSRWNSGLGDAGIMVNLFPEDKEADPRKSPCWLDSDREDGLLDAISKHFMLAQGVDATIDSFNENSESNWYGWTAKEVLYAGTFEVDVESCTLHVNGDSGTYQPKTSYRILTKVANQFDDTISMDKISDAMCRDGIEVKD